MTRRLIYVSLVSVLLLGLLAGLARLGAFPWLKGAKAADLAGKGAAAGAPTPAPSGPGGPPPSGGASPPAASLPRHDQPPGLKPEAPFRSPDWTLLDWAVSPHPGKPGAKLRASAWSARGKHSFIRVEEEIDGANAPRVLHRKEMVGDHIIVKLPAGSAQRDAQRIAGSIGAKAGPAPFAPETWLFMLGRELDAVPLGMQSLKSSGADIEYTEPDLIVRPARLPDDPKVTDFTTWHLYNNTQLDKDIKAARAWDRRTSAAHGTTNKVIVAVLDSGVRYSHQDLSANMWRNPGEIAGDGIDNENNGWIDDVHGIDAVGTEDWTDRDFDARRDGGLESFFYEDANSNGRWDQDTDPMDTDGHGTHCAGLIGAVGNNGTGLAGIAWSGVEIMALRFIDGTGAVSDEVLCMDYARLRGAKVINASFGQNGGTSQAEIDAINRLNSSGVILVAAAGNGGSDFVGDNNNGPAPFYPASYTNGNIIAVGATDRNDNKTAVSNFGPTAVDLFAPGEAMYSTRAGSDSAYGSGGGTSFAAPVVSGALALLIAEYPNDTVSQRVARMVSANAVDAVPALGGLCVTGGRLNLAKLLPAADPGTLQQALVWHRPAHNEGLINSLMRTPASVIATNLVTVYSGMRKFNNTNGVNTSGLVNQTGGWLFHRAVPSAAWSSNALSWHTDNGDYQFWKATLSNLPSGTIEYYLQLNFDSGARTTYSFHANNADGFLAGTNEPAAQASPYTFPVAKATAVVSIGATNQTYDGTARSVSVATKPPGLATAVTYDGNASPPTNAGTYTVVATVNDANYQGSATNTLAVGKAAPVITAAPTAAAITYGQTLGLSALSGGAANVSGTFAFTAPSTAPSAGSASQSVTFIPADSTNYSTAVTDALVTVNKATAGLAIGNLTQGYDGTARAVSVTTTPAGLPVAVSYNGSSSPPVEAGAYDVVATITDPNHEGSSAATLTIKAPAGLTIGGLSKTYDTTAHAVTVTTVPPDLPVTVTYNGSLEAPVDAGNYEVAATVTDAGYHGAATATLTIAKATPLITGAPVASAITYEQALNESVLSGGAASVPGVFAFTEPDTYPGAGTATRSVTFTPADAANYESVQTSIAVVVNKAAATVELHDLGQVYDGAPRMVAVDTAPHGLATTVTYDGNGEPPTEAGSYAVAATVDDPNYDGSASGTLTVAKAPANVEISGLQQIYDGTPKPVTTATDPVGLDVAVTYDGEAGVPVGAGAYVVEATIDDANHEGAVTATLNVAKAAAGVELGNLSQTFDGTARGASVTTSPADLVATVTYNGSVLPPTNAGTYTVVATVNEADYEGSAAGILTVAKATPLVTSAPTASAITYGQSLASSMLVGGSASVGGTFSFTSPASAPVAGTASQSITFIPADTTNHHSVVTSALVTVNKATAVVTLGNLSRHHDGLPKPVTVTTDPPGLGVSVTYDGSLSVPSAVGDYEVLATVTDPNHEGSASGTLSILSGTVTFESLFGDADTTSDSDRDGIPALAEYGIGGTPAGHDQALLPRTEANSRLALIAVVRTNDPRLSAHAETSTNMAAGWSGTLVHGAPHDDQAGVPDGFQRRVYHIDASSDAQRFMRLRFTLEPQPQ